MCDVRLSKKARKGYETYSEYRQSFDSAFDMLSSNPFPFREFDLAKLKGMQNSYRIRLGKMRLKYNVIEQEKVITVFYIGPREGAYD